MDFTSLRVAGQEITNLALGANSDGIITIAPFIESTMEGKWSELSLDCIPINSKEMSFKSTEFGVTLLDENIGGILPDFGKAFGFPKSFVEGLKPATQALILNELVEKADSDSETGKGYYIVRDNDKFARLVPATRANKILHDSDIIEKVCSFAASALNRELTVDYHHTVGKSVITFGNWGFREPVTPKEGDVLDAKVVITNEFGVRLSSELSINRLVCDNGMRANKAVFSWQQESIRLTPEFQLVWLVSQAVGSIEAFMNLVERAKKMAETPIEPEKVDDTLKTYARSMGIPKRFDEQILLSFREEPECTVWGALNAFTHFATHSGAPQQNTQNVLLSAGNWVSNFDVVRARLPRSIAESIGAEILSDELVPA